MPLASLLSGFKRKDHRSGRSVIASDRRERGNLTRLLRRFAPRNDNAGPTLRVAVVGVGRMGQRHAHAIPRITGLSLTALVDLQRGIAQRLARRLRTQAFEKPEDLLGRVEAVALAVPTPEHFRLGKLFLEAGVHTLMEKPIAQTVEEAETLIALAEEKGLVLQVGHVERFNPAVVEALRYIREPRFIEVNRLGPYDPRVAHIGVVLDLMIHDLDIVLFLVGEAVERLEAFGARVLSDHEDIAKVRLVFKNGCVADLSASRISLERFRKIRVFQKDSYLSLDYARPSLKVYRKRRPEVRSLRDIEVLTPRLFPRDPIAMEWEHFLACIKEKREPAPSGRHGREALALAHEILKRMQYD